MRYLRGFDERLPDRPVSGIGTVERKHAANEQYYDDSGALVHVRKPKTK